MKFDVAVADPIVPDYRAASCPAAKHDESAARFLYELSPDVILFLDKEGNILCVNSRGIELSGYSETQLRGANIFERLLLSEDRPVVRQMLDDAVNGNTRECEVCWRTKDGEVIQFDGTFV